MTPHTSTQAGGSTIEVRDRRDLPFFQIRLVAIAAIREQVSGPRRLRTIGLYGLLCQLANEQRRVSEQRSVRFSYELLAGRGGVGMTQLKAMLDSLGTAGVIRQERVVDRERGTTVSVAHLLILEDPWLAITVAMAQRLAQPRPHGHLLRDLGLVSVLLEFCAAQRHETGGLAAAVSRAELAARAGLAVDRLDDCHRVLCRAGVLTITRRRPANGGRNLPSLYTIHEAPAESVQGGETGAPGRRNGNARAVDREFEGGGSGISGRLIGSPRAVDQESQGGESALAPSVSPPSNAHAVRPVENGIEPLTPTVTERSTAGGGGSIDDCRQLCEQFLQAWSPVLGDAPARAFEDDRGAWFEAAARLLSRHSQERIRRAMDGMLCDEILSGRSLTLPAFERVCDQLIARQFARATARRPRTAAAVSAGHASWSEVRAALERAVQRHGRDGRESALGELSAVDGLLTEFVAQVRWSALCEQPMQFAERRYRDLWAELTTTTPEESAA